MKTIQYLCYGNGPQVAETKYSLLSAQRLSPPEENIFQYVIYSDYPSLFDGFDVVLRTLDAQELTSWMGGSDYVHRRKTVAIIDALERYPGSVAFVDCDTYFTSPPTRLFERIAPGHSCLHLREARLLEAKQLLTSAISDLVTNSNFTDLAGHPYHIPADAMMWNSGVIGIHSDDKHLMHETLHLVDEMWKRLKLLKLQESYGYKIHHIEQFATGVVLSNNKLRESGDIVFHYWPENLRQPFRKILPELLADTAEELPALRADHLYARRPHADWARKVKQRLRFALRAMGINVPGMRASA